MIRSPTLRHHSMTGSLLASDAERPSMGRWEEPCGHSVPPHACESRAGWRGDWARRLGLGRFSARRVTRWLSPGCLPARPVRPSVAARRDMGSGGTAGRLRGELTEFVGRRAELTLIRQALGSARLVTLTGPGGVGKTRLGLQGRAGAGQAGP